MTQYKRWKAICDRCGFERWNHQIRLEWNGLRVCADTCWEPRHPQDLIRVRPERQRVNDPRPRPEDVFLSANEITPDSL